MLLILTGENNSLIKVDDTDATVNDDVSYENNKITLKYSLDNFVTSKKIDYKNIDEFCLVFMNQMKQNKITFDNLIQNNNQEVQNWILNIANFKDTFEQVEVLRYARSNEFYSLKLKGNSDYILEWNENQNNDNNYQLINNELTINFLNTYEISNNSINQLFSIINQMIENHNLDYYDIVQCINDKNNNEYSLFKKYIFNQLNSLLNNSLPNIDFISNISLSDDNNQFSLKIDISNKYNLLSNSTYYQNGSIILTNLKFSEYITFTGDNFNNFHNSLQNWITQNQILESDMATLVTTDEFKDFISKNLFKSNGDNIDINQISSISYNNNTIIISPANLVRFKLLSNAQNITINDDNIVISNLNYLTKINFIKLNNLFDAINNDIFTNKYDVDKFVNKISNDPDSIKDLIANNLYISNQTTLDYSQIKSISFSNNVLSVSLNENNNKYSAEQNDNITLENNTLLISNLKFFTVIKFTKLNTLFDFFQNTIDSNKYTEDDLINYLKNNLNIKNLVGNNLYISENEKIDSSLIKSVDVENGIIKITLNQDSYTLFAIESNKNIELNNNILSVNNLTYYLISNVINLNKVFDTIQDTIKNKEFTEEEFARYVNENNSDLKKDIANALNSQNSFITIANIDSIVFYNNNLVINLIPNNYEKYNFEEYKNATYNNNTITIINLEYYSITNVVNLNSVFDAIQDIIKNNKWTNDEFKDYVNKNNSEFKTEIAKSLNSQNPSISIDNIDSIIFNNNNVEINLIPNSNQKYHFEEFINATYNNNTITIINLEYYSINNIIDLNSLFNGVQEKIDVNKFTESEFEDYVKSDNDKLKDLILEKMNIQNPSISIDNIDSVKFINNNLEINLIPNDKQKFNFENYEHATFEDNKITIIDLRYFTEITINNPDFISKFLQDKINENEFDFDEFSNDIIVNQSSIIDEIAKGLSTNSGSITSDRISNISVNINNVLVELNPLNYTKYTINSTNNITLSNNLLTISNFKYYRSINLINLDTLHNAIETQVSSNQYTSVSYKQYVLTNPSKIKEIIADNLYTSANTKIDPSLISNISLNDNKQLEINLASDYIKYIAQSTNSVILNKSILLVNIDYFNNEILITNDKLDNLKTHIQDFVYENRYGANELNNEINKSLKESIAKYLSINNDSLGNISFKNGEIEINPAENKRFVSTPNNSNLISNNIISISDIKICKDVEINVNLLRNYLIGLQLLVLSECKTSNDFNAWFEKQTDLKSTIASAINISQDLIGDIELGDYEIIVNPARGKRFIMSSDSFVINSELTTIITNGAIYLNGFSFQSGESIIPEWILEKFHYDFQSAIKNTRTTESGFKSQLNLNDANNQLELLISLMLRAEFLTYFNSIQTIISEYTVENEIFVIKPIDGSYFTSTNPNSKYVTSSKSLSYKFKFFPEPGTITPESYFTWNGDTITGLTEEGKEEFGIVIPSRAKAISYNAFSDNDNLVVLDFRKTNITEIPNGTSSGGFIANSNNLEVIHLPESLERIGEYSFSYCHSDKLTIYEYSKILNYVGNNAFIGCSREIKISIPFSVYYQIEPLFIKSSSNLNKNNFSALLS